MSEVVFVTGTDTGVGKTVVTAALAVVASLRGTVAVMKPAQTGVGADEPGDLQDVARLTGLGDLHEGVRLRDPLAPTTAGRREGVPLPSVDTHAKAILDLATSHDTVIVEGAGGLLVGLDEQGHNLADVAARLVDRLTAARTSRSTAGAPATSAALGTSAAPASSGVPGAAGVPGMSGLVTRVRFVVVARAGLGTLNHAGLTVEALRARELPVGGLVIGSWPAAPDLAEQCNLEDLPATTGVPVIGRIAEGAGRLERAAFVAAAPGWFSSAPGATGWLQ
jgi:dethiobiotin synthetase